MKFIFNILFLLFVLPGAMSLAIFDDACKEKFGKPLISQSDEKLWDIKYFVLGFILEFGILLFVLWVFWVL